MNSDVRWSESCGFRREKAEKRFAFVSTLLSYLLDVTDNHVTELMGGWNQNWKHWTIRWTGNFKAILSTIWLHDSHRTFEAFMITPSWAPGHHFFYLAWRRNCAAGFCGALQTTVNNLIPRKPRELQPKSSYSLLSSSGTILRSQLLWDWLAIMMLANLTSGGWSLEACSPIMMPFYFVSVRRTAIGECYFPLPRQQCVVVFPDLT